MVTNAALKNACEQLLLLKIPYTQLDCQAAVEEAYKRAGVAAKTVDLSGSNAHYRACYWTGTPERLLEIIGAKECPAGIETYIVANDGGEPGKYKADLRGNASHMGIYLGGGRTFNSSEKMGGIVVSTKFNGKKQAVSGSWNMVGLKSYVDYGLTEQQIAKIKADGNFKGVADIVSVQIDLNSNDIDVTGFYTVKIGSKGGAVQRLQTWLAQKLGYDLQIDHDFGRITEAAVRDFQAKNGLVVDGIVGRATWAALAKAIGAKG